MNKRIPQKEQTRERILDAAYSLFSQRGFIDVSTIDVAEDARVSHGTLFSHFVTRDELVNAVICRFGENMIKRMHDLAETRNSLRSVLEAHLDCLKESEPFYSQLLRDLHSLPKNSGLQMICILSGVSHHIFLAAQNETRDKKILPLPADLLFNTWIGLVHHYLVNRDVFATGSSVIAEQRETLVDHFMTLVKP